MVHVNTCWNNFQQKGILQVLNPEAEGSEPFKILTKSIKKQIKMKLQFIFYFIFFKQINYGHLLYFLTTLFCIVVCLKKKWESRWKSLLKLSLISTYLNVKSEVALFAFHSLISGRLTRRTITGNPVLCKEFQ